jgi:hypothetical protein
MTRMRMEVSWGWSRLAPAGFRGDEERVSEE